MHKFVVTPSLFREQLQAHPKTYSMNSFEIDNFTLGKGYDRSKDEVELNNTDSIDFEFESHIYDDERRRFKSDSYINNFDDEKSKPVEFRMTQPFERTDVPLSDFIHDPDILKSPNYTQASWSDLVPSSRSTNTQPNNILHTTTSKRSTGSSKIGAESPKSMATLISKSPKRTRNKNSPTAKKQADLPEGDDPESRKKRRLMRNRLSAKLHRDRERQAMEDLEQEREKCDDKIASLERQFNNAEAKRRSLQAVMDALRQHLGNDAVNRVLTSNPLASSILPTVPAFASTSGSDNADRKSVV